jgi:hypothetical protein
MPGNTNRTPRRMRSTIVSIGLVGALAASLTGCGSRTQARDARCVDMDSFDVVPEQNCLATPTATGTSRSTTGRRYGYYYGGRTSGSRVSGGSFTAPSGVSSGGFGKSATGKSSTSGGKSGGSSSGGGKSGGS